MRITPVDTAVPALTEVRPGRPLVTHDPGPALAARIGAALSAPDAAAALRVLVEEVRTELQARLGPGAASGTGRAGALDADATAALLLRWLRGPAQAVASPATAFEEAAARARAILAGSARLPPGAAVAIDEVVTRVRAGLASLASRATPPTPAQQLAPAVAREVTAALAERVGLLPAAARPGPAPADAASSLQQLAQLFRAVAADSVVAVRASPRIAEAAVRDGVQRALASLPEGIRGDPAVRRLAADLTVLSLRAAGVVPGQSLPSPPADPPGMLRTLVDEFRLALAETLRQRAPPPTAESPRDASRALGAFAAAAGTALSRMPDAALAAQRPALEAALDVALARSLLQLPAGADAALRRVMEQLPAQFRALLAAAQAAAAGRGLEPAAALSLLVRAGEALQEGGSPPFRFDLPVPRGASARRRLPRGAPDESIEAIASSDPGPEDEAGDEGPAGPPLWPRPPAT